MIGICRHRIATDGQGVTTLVAFHGCPLRCKYCLNAQCLRADGIWRQMTVQEILDEVTRLLRICQSARSTLMSIFLLRRLLVLRIACSEQQKERAF